MRRESSADTMRCGVRPATAKMAPGVGGGGGDGTKPLAPHLILPGCSLQGLVYVVGMAKNRDSRKVAAGAARGGDLGLIRDSHAEGGDRGDGARDLGEPQCGHRGSLGICELSPETGGLGEGRHPGGCEGLGRSSHHGREDDACHRGGRDGRVCERAPRHCLRLS